MRFQADLSEGLKAQRPKRDPADKKRIKELEREVRRENRALAEAVKLLRWRCFKKSQCH